MTRARQNIHEKVRKYLYIFTKNTIEIFTINEKIIEIFMYYISSIYLFFDKKNYHDITLIQFWKYLS